MSVLSEIVAPSNRTSREIFVIVRENFTTYYKCRGSITLSEFVLLPYSLIGTCNSEQNCIFVRSAEGGARTHTNLCILVGHSGVTKPECP
jgi:hypothetical protein